MLHGATPSELFFAVPLHISFSWKFQRVTGAWDGIVVVDEMLLAVERTSPICGRELIIVFWRSKQNPHLAVWVSLKGAMCTKISPNARKPVLGVLESNTRNVERGTDRQTYRPRSSVRSNRLQTELFYSRIQLTGLCIYSLFSFILVLKISNIFCFRFLEISNIFCFWFLGGTFEWPCVR